MPFFEFVGIIITIIVLLVFTYMILIIAWNQISISWCVWYVSIISNSVKADYKLKRFYKIRLFCKFLFCLFPQKLNDTQTVHPNYTLDFTGLVPRYTITGKRHNLFTKMEIFVVVIFVLSSLPTFYYW